MKERALKLVVVKADAAAPVCVCLSGKLCTANGLTEPDMSCPGGHLCSAGTASLESAQRCPAGFVCEEGAVDTKACPRGTLGTYGGFGSAVQCRPCTGGSFCDGTTPGTSTGLCKPGFYCEEGSQSSWAKLCPVGKVCPEGSASPGLCPAGFSTSAPGSTMCTKCAPGTTCNEQEPRPCEEGFYCQPGHASQACPAGTYMPFQGATKESSCLTCPAGKKPRDCNTSFIPRRRSHAG